MSHVQAPLLCLALITTPAASINFPGPSESAASRLVFGRSFSTASCSVSGVTPTTVELNIGEGRVFQSPGYPSNYPNLQECTYNFQPAAGAQLKFSCSDVDLTATSATGALCTGDYLRFYDASGSLGGSGTRYCYSDKPDFTYASNINVLFKTNNDGNTGKGYDCQVVAEAITTTTTTTTPSASDCVTIGGPGSSKPCKTTFSYGHQRTQYKGCINQETPGQYLTLVPDFGDNAPAPSSADSSVSTNSITFSSAPGTPVAPRSSSSSTVVRTLFWCATETDAEGFVSEWGKCAAGCLADPAGSYLPAAPRSVARQRVTVGELQQLIREVKPRPGPQFA